MQKIVPHVSNILALKKWSPFHSTELYDGYLIAVLHWAAEGGTDLRFYWNMEKQKKYFDLKNSLLWSNRQQQPYCYTNLLWSHKSYIKQGAGCRKFMGSSDILRYFFLIATWRAELHLNISNPQLLIHKSARNQVTESFKIMIKNLTPKIKTTNKTQKTSHLL